MTHAMAWLAVTPAAGLRTPFPTADFRCFSRFHLGLPLTQVDEPEGPRCSSPMETSGHHLVCCPRNGIVQRHGAVQDVFLRAAKQAGFVARREQAPPDRTRPGDVFIARLDANGPAAVDITVRHTLAPSRPLRAAGDVAPWHETQEKEKVVKYLGQCRRLGCSMVPFVQDCFGGFGTEARSLETSFLRLLLGQN